ncbi:RICIN domain-containing protein [Actinoplanes sp. NPDC051494]|uniref:RICIN domain-containing protein n=1 Tax=Actinoplanes sp. NPDC051494 TaxID=3363907 RepID=UPI0037943164
MTRPDPVRAWGRLTATRRGRLQLISTGVVLLLLAGVAWEVAPAIANAEKIEGRPLSAEQLPAVVTAALSCPLLTPPRLAGQLMALSVDRSGDEPAGLISDADWKTWKPRRDARIADPADTVLALAHQTCALAGRIRAAGTEGDLWQLAVAAQHGGITAVVDAGGVPGADRAFVDRAAGYAAWYAGSGQFSREAIASVPAAPATGTFAVPGELIAALNESGRICPGVTPARLAAQLRAASTFDANLRTDRGQGIAQFGAQLWEQYASPARSVYDAGDAIAVLGTAMCDLSGQFSGFGGDPYPLALGAFQWGADTVRLAGGLPLTTVPQFATAVLSHVPEYEKDTRLTKSRGTAPKPSAPARPGTPSTGAPSSPAAGKPRSPAPPEPVTTTTSSPAAPEPGNPAAPQLYDPTRAYLIRNVHAGAVIQMPGDDVASLASGTKVEMWQDQESQDRWWTVSAAPDGEHVVITNKLSGMSLAVENASMDEYALIVVQTTDASDENQQWTLEDAGDGELFVTNRHSGRLMDLHGDDVPPPNGSWNGYDVQQWPRQDTARDQRWKLVG